jgi:hypothetical protein
MTDKVVDTKILCPNQKVAEDGEQRPDLGSRNTLEIGFEQWKKGR